MRTSTKSLLSLDQWVSVINLDPYFISQIGDGTLIRARGQTDGVLYQYAWQQVEQLGREEIVQGIADAEAMFAGLANYWPAPKFITAEQVYPNNYHSSDLWSTRWDYRGFPKTVKTRYERIRSTGTQVLTEIGDVNVVASDTDGDGLNDRFTATATVPAGTLPTEVQTYFISTDRAGLRLDECRIRDIQVSITGTTATIVGKMYCLVLPSLELRRDAASLNATDAIYATQVNVQRETIDLNDSGQLQWELPNCNQPPCSVELSSGCFGARSAELGILTYVPAEYNATTEQFVQLYPDQGYRDPDRMFVNYYAGYPLDPDTQRMDALHARIITYLSATLIPCKTEGVRRADQRLNYWQQPPRDQDQTTLLLSEVDSRNPFGISRGAIEAWRLMVNNDIVGMGAVNTGGR